MTRSNHVMRTAAVCAVTLFLAAPPAAAQGKELASTPPAQSIAKKAHRLVLQVNTNEPAMMNLALNNATNVEQYYKNIGEKVEIEIVTFGPGLHMLRDDTSPVKDRIKAIAEKSRSTRSRPAATPRTTCTRPKTRTFRSSRRPRS